MASVRCRGTLGWRLTSLAGNSDTSVTQDWHVLTAFHSVSSRSFWFKAFLIETRKPRFPVRPLPPPEPQQGHVAALALGAEEVRALREAP